MFLVGKGSAYANELWRMIEMFGLKLFGNS